MKLIDRILLKIFKAIYLHFSKTQHITDFEKKHIDILIRRIKERTRF